LPNIAPFETEFAHSVADHKYMAPHGETHWHQAADRTVAHPMDSLRGRIGDLDTLTGAIQTLVRERKFMPGGRYLYAAGNDFHQVQNCLLLACEDTREGWADLGWKAKMSLLTGAGIGVYWGKVRPNGTPVRRTGGTASGPVPEIIATNETGRSAVQGGDRRSAIWAGLLWSHADIFWFNRVKDWPQYIKDAQAAHLADPINNPEVPAACDMTNISVCLDDDFFAAFEDPTFSGPIIDQLGVAQHRAPDGGSWHDWAQRCYWDAVDRMTQTGEPGFSIDIGEQRDEKLRNACTEIVSADDSDICNLGGLVLSRFTSPDEFERAVRLGVLFLTAGTEYSHVPYERVSEVRDKNRRLGLDMLGVHEFLLRRGLRYGTDEAFEALEPYMLAYDRALEYANEWQDKAGLSRSIAATSGAPTGTRGIVAETTTGWEPITYAAYKRSVITSKAHAPDERTVHYVVDPTVERLLREGVVKPSDDVEDSYSLAYDYERRFKMQEYAQRHTDQAISMTINLPYVMTNPRERRDFGECLYKYLPGLRGITVYPDGAIAGQPITRVPLSVATDGSYDVEETEEKCASGVCGL
jgi:ribonucleoside-diphosphate reductase alpha chain